MNEFLEALSRALGKLSPQEREDILSDYREHFEAGLGQGKTERQIARELGEPKDIARMYTAQSAADKAEKSGSLKDAWGMVGAALAYKLGGGLTVGMLYTAFALVMAVIWALGPVLLLGAAAGALLAVMEFSKGFAVYGIIAVLTAGMLTSLGALSLIGAKALWKAALGIFSKMARRLTGKGKEKKQ